MEQFQSEHYLFHYGKDTAAERDIKKIVAEQEACFRHICTVLGVTPSFQLIYYLCDSPEEVGRIYGDNEPCNGFNAPPDTIYAVYNERIKCVGFHEDAHLISYVMNRPDCPAVREGLAMFFDRKWWAIHNLDWTGYFLAEGRYLPIDRLLDRDFFFDHPCSVTYPIVGAFTEWLIDTYGMEKYLSFYRQKESVHALERVYCKTPVELNTAFVDYVRLFRVDEAVKRRMAELLQNDNN